MDPTNRFLIRLGSTALAFMVLALLGLLRAPAPAVLLAGVGAGAVLILILTAVNDENRRRP